MPLLLTEQDVRDLSTMDDAIAALESAHKSQGAGRAVNDPRRRLRAPHGALAIMPGGDAETGFLGFKTAFYAAGAVHVLLYDMTERKLAAIIQANWLGTLRTGAASGVATKYMAREDAEQTVGIIGTGMQARTQVSAVCAVRNVSRVLAYGRDEDRRKTFAERMSERVGVPVEPVDNAQIVGEADIVITATNASSPVLEGAWLKAGAHVNAIGSNSLLRREIDMEAVRRADVIVVDDREQTAIESGDLQEPIERGIVDLARLPELGDIVAGGESARRSDSDITLFESHGIGLWDVALATHVYRAAIEQGRGAEADI
ncbi:MAG: ornithine cyclodeaminase family protein [Dehalococcoidia bacterium]|nr:ornithine cyclodeaminase family protein [Dehalococcoidia bacterium]